MVPFIGIALAAVSAISGLKQAKEQKKAARAGNEAIRQQNLRERRNFLKSVRQARAQALTQGVASGAALESSGSSGVQTSIHSQLAETEDFTARQLELGAEQARKLEKASKYSTISALASTGVQIASAVNDIRSRENELTGVRVPNHKKKTNISTFGPPSQGQ